MMGKNRKNRGFTLLELLIVIAILAILAAIIFVAVDPARRLAEARNAERWSAVNAVLNAYLKYTVDNGGTPPGTLTNSVGATTVTDVQVLGTTADNGAGFCAGLAADYCNASVTVSPVVDECFVDLSGSSDLVDQYLAAIPQDPATGSAADTRYYINKSANGRITVGACDPEDATGGGAPTIQVKR